MAGGWKGLLAQVDTHHLLSNFAISVQGDEAETFSHVYASLADGIGYWNAFGRYRYILKKVDDEWKITAMTLIMHGQKGNKNFLQEVIHTNEKNANAPSQIKNQASEKVQFNSEEQKIVGNLFFAR